MDNGDLFGALLAGALSDDSTSSSSSSSDDDFPLEELDVAEKNRQVYVSNYWATINSYDDVTFRSHFRLNREGVERVVNLLENGVQVNTGRPPVESLKAALLTCWTLANQESLRGIGDRFGFSKGHTYRIVVKVCEILKGKAHQFIKFPTTDEELANVADGFRRLHRRHPFPNVVGCVDGTHIGIPGPANDNSYYNRKGFHSIILQGVCDAKQKFIDIFVGYPGSSIDARVWNESPLGRSLQAGDINLQDYHLLGDKAYPLKKYVITPYRDNGQLTRRHREINQILSSTRVTIEQAYGRLKGMFRRLKHCHVYKVENCTSIAMAACVLHNIAIDVGVEDNFEVEEEEVEDNLIVEEDDDDGDAAIERNRLMLEITR